MNGCALCQIALALDAQTAPAQYGVDQPSPLGDAHLVPRPLLDAYLAVLPDGLASYTSFQQKGSVTRALLEQWPEARSLKALPPALAELVADPPLASA